MTTIINQLVIQKNCVGMMQATYFYDNSIKWIFQTEEMSTFKNGILMLFEKEESFPKNIVKTPNKTKEYDKELIQFIDFLEKKFNS
ncbi:hypothetical protein KGV55_03855 [Candidatus Gracilibacteria bacterium]|nr:hypothetical protein [Candidatus Gracilibacteria bacterium]